MKVAGAATQQAWKVSGRRKLRIERRDSAVFRSGGRPVYRKAGRLTPPSSVEVGVREQIAEAQARALEWANTNR